ncbi:hypothetical protein BCD64_20455 [Nostoc sp. MBR 210]|uniref:Uncharacterized protein n=1 Tax=Nostoc spongiaeforme FACHB-130 TaxID=1357510 RepID=A0ABR8FPJ1_9NOSO|nr:hypothetical protein [Nostoc spongiaeforme]MBD2592766.1 hypothetical protein [Nostoc spongiaeforme FACHB-130]OCQ94801.1 hypothetical protein BCD64_20455 [Nostoc sp. MBR 210]
MPLVSTFELLVNPIAPTDNLGNLPPDVVQKLGRVARRVVQGYFLTIANTTDAPARLRLEFTATTPELNLVDTVTIRDVLGNNEFSELIPVPGNPRRFTFNVGIPANDTALVTLLPDLQNVDLFTGAKNLEIRGYVSISRATIAGPAYELLVTPEHRGTFLPRNIDDSVPDFDQIAYALPTASGGSLVRLPSLVRPPVVISQPGEPNVVDDSQEVLSLMAQRLEELEQRLANV